MFDEYPPLSETMISTRVDRPRRMALPGNDWAKRGAGRRRKAQGSSFDVFSHYLDPSGLHIVWNDRKEQPATIRGKLLAFETADAATAFVTILNFVHRRRGVGRSRRFAMPKLPQVAMARPILVD